MITSAYFIATAFTKREEGLLDSNQPRKLFIDPQTNKFDFKMVIMLILAAIMQMSIIIAIAYNFKLARQAGLNIGIA